MCRTEAAVKLNKAHKEGGVDLAGFAQIGLAYTVSPNCSGLINQETQAVNVYMDLVAEKKKQTLIRQVKS